ncbi:MAG TPA: hypothetical protein VJA21_01705 [Verrucomicrobiae bacterium]
MKGYLPQIVCGLSLLLGLSIGWYFGYTRPAIRMHRLDEEVLKETGMSGKEAAKAVPEALAAIKREDESTALVSLKAVGMLNRGDIERAEKYLAYWVGSYYRVYQGQGGDSNLLKEIKAVAATNKFVEAEISKNPGK